MATIYQNHTFIEGYTDNNATYKLELLLAINQYPKENKSEVSYTLQWKGKNNNTPEEADADRIVLELYGDAYPFEINYINNITGYKQLGADYPVYYEDRYTLGKKFNMLTSYSLRVYPGGEEMVATLQTGKFTVYHELDGTAAILYRHAFYGIVDKNNEKIFSHDSINTMRLSISLPQIDRAVIPTMADMFTDEANPNFSYEAVTGISNVYYYYTKRARPEMHKIEDTITSLQAALSLDGETIDIPFRDIPIGSTTYRFELTEADRDVLRQKAQGSNTVPIYYITKVKREVSYDTSYSNYYKSGEFINKTERSLTIVGCNPVLNPTVKDINPDTLALTGDENTFVRYESMAEYAINATPSKHATIVSQSVQCGNKTIKDLPYGVIDDVESGDFNFYVSDSRNMAAASTVFKNFVEYIKPTCNHKLEIALYGETEAQIKVTISGNIFIGSFGASNNPLKLEMRYTDDNGVMGNWGVIRKVPTYSASNQTYTLETTISGFNYGKAYTFQCRATDKLNTVESSQYTIRLLPVFDWSETDFNFNVPVNINADSINMNGEAIIRHNKEANNTVLSATGGHIYLRPGGTDDTSGETVISPDGSINFGGAINFDNTVNFNYSFTVGGYILNDYVIETGSEAMGTNGTWYWRKWLSGKAEAWGCRNFGNIAVSTAWGSLYRSAVFTQDLPDGVFKRTPDAININFVHTDAGGWISKYQNTAPSATTTGSFVVIRPVSGNITPTNIGFYIVGEW